MFKSVRTGEAFHCQKLRRRKLNEVAFPWQQRSERFVSWYEVDHRAAVQITENSTEIKKINKYWRERRKSVILNIIQVFKNCPR